MAGMSSDDPRPHVIRSSISTTQYSRAYLLHAWSTRVGLAPYARYGFGQFIYLTITGHVEASMGEIIERRLASISQMAYAAKDGALTMQNQGESVTHSYGPVYPSLRGILGRVARDIDNGPLDKLKELFQDVFAVKLSDALGDLNLDLAALSKLRNVFAHGRELVARFGESRKMTFDDNPLQLPAQRLLASGIFKNLEIDAWAHDEFQATFYSDDALRYFYDRARQIEEKLKGFLTFPPETFMPLMISLPDLPD
jgi:hypothetical protein